MLTRGSTTQPAWATVDHASRRTTSSWRSAMTLPSVMLSVASTAMARTTGVPSTATARSTTSRAARAATLDTVARNVATGTDEPAYAVGVHAWNGTSESLKPTPARTSTGASATTPPDTDGRAAAAPDAAVDAAPEAPDTVENAPPDDSAASGVRNGLPVPANYGATPSTSRANETSEVTSSCVAPATADRRPERATSAMTGRLASSSATSQVPTARLAATTTVPDSAASSSTASTGSRVLPVGRLRRARGHARAMQTAAERAAASWSVVPRASACHRHTWGSPPPAGTEPAARPVKQNVSRVEP